MPIQRKSRGPGRPRDLAKIDAILDAAFELFRKHGIAATTIDAVAERASVSKMTVYANFQDKPALLAAVFDHKIKAKPVLNLAAAADLNSSIARLVVFGEHIVSALTKPDVIGMGRCMTECVSQHPRLAATYYTAGLGEMVKRVAVFLRELNERGFLSIKDPDLAAEQLVASWLGMSIGRQSLGLAGPPSADAIEKRVRYAVDTMVGAWSAGSDATKVQKFRFKSRF
jgi:TetR/AcrR family transcriptional repressor of mexJK operon